MNKRQLLALVLIPAMLAACGGGDDSFDDRADIAPPKVRLVHAVPGGNADWLLVPVLASVTPGDVHVRVVQSDTGTPATELINQP